jgi:hypothetical protein
MANGGAALGKTIIPTDAEIDAIRKASEATNRQ